MTWSEEQARKRALVKAKAVQTFLVFMNAMQREIEDFETHGLGRGGLVTIRLDPYVSDEEGDDDASFWVHVTVGTDPRTVGKIDAHISLVKQQDAIIVNIARDRGSESSPLPAAGTRYHFCLEGNGTDDLSLIEKSDKVDRKPKQAAHFLMSELLKGTPVLHG